MGCKIKVVTRQTSCFASALLESLVGEKELGSAVVFGCVPLACYMHHLIFYLFYSILYSFFLFPKNFFLWNIMNQENIASRWLEDSEQDSYSTRGWRGERMAHGQP